MNPMTRRTSLALLAGTAARVAIGAPSERAAPRGEIVAHKIPTANAKPYIIVPGPDGNAWFTESEADKIGCFKPASQTLVEFDIPTKACRAIGIIAGGDRHLWFSESAANRIGRISLQGQVEEFTCPTPNAGPNGMYCDTQGLVWFAQSNVGQIASISSDGRISEYGAGISAGARPLSLTERDGAIWFSEPEANRLAWFRNGIATEVALPPGRQPRAMVSHPDGNLWFVATSAQAMVRLERSGRMTEFPAPGAGASLRSLTVAPDGNIWFTEDLIDRIGVMTSEGRMLAEYPLPSSMHGLRGIAALADGRIVFAAYESGHIGEWRSSAASSMRGAPVSGMQDAVTGAG